MPPFKLLLSKAYCYSIKLTLFVLVVLTFYLVVGRQFMPMLNIQKGNVVAELSDLLGSEISIGELNGDWFRFSPVIVLQDLEIPYSSFTLPDETVDSPVSVSSSMQNASHKVEWLRVTLDVARSLFNRQISVTEVSMSGVSVHLLEREDGSWGVRGFGGNAGGTSERLFDFFLDTPNLELNESQIILQLQDGSVIELNNMYAKLSNAIDRHDLQVQFRFFTDSEPLHFQLELIGDPKTDLTGSAYLDFTQSDYSQMLMALQQSRQFSRDAIVNEAVGSGQFWFDFESSALLSVNGKFRDGSLIAKIVDPEVAINLGSTSVDFTLEREEVGLWQFELQNLEFDWHNSPWLSSTIAGVFDSTDEKMLLDLTMDTIDLSRITEALDSVGLSESGRRVLMDLQPAGQMKNIHFRSDLLGHYPNGFELSANLENVKVGAWKGAPSAAGIDAYVKTNLKSGFAELDSKNFEIHLPKIFSEKWHYDSINSRVDWLVENNQVKVKSSIIDVHNEGLDGRVQFGLDITQREPGEWETDLSLLVGITRFDARKKDLYLPTLQKVQTSMEWLDGAILSGDVSHSGFVFRGLASSSPKEPLNTKTTTLQTFYNIENARVKYLPDWPVLENIKGSVLVRNNDVDIEIETSNISDITLSPSTVSIRKNRINSRVWLNVNAKAETSASTGLDFLRSSPAGEGIGGYLDNWVAEGEIALDVNVGIELKGSSNEETPPVELDVGVMFSNSSLNIPDYYLNVEEINGQINYNNFNNLSATNLAGIMLGAPVQVAIESYNRHLPGSMLMESGVVVNAMGQVTRDALLAQPNMPEFVRDVLSFGEGTVEYEAQLDVFSQNNTNDVLSRLTINSDLMGMKFDFPEPFLKMREDVTPLVLEVDFLENSQVLTARYNDDFYTQLQIQDEVIGWGQLYFGTLNQEFSIRQANTTQPGLLISGELEYFDYDSWNEVSKRFVTASADSSIDDSSLEKKIRLIDVNIETLEVFEQELNSINVQVEHSQSAWNIFLDSLEIKGQLTFSDDRDIPYEMKFDHLYLPATPAQDELNESESSYDALLEVDPKQLPNINFHAADLRVGDKELGQWNFISRGNSRGVSISEITIAMEDVELKGTIADKGAELEWLYTNGEHSTHFESSLQVGNLADILPKWGYSASIVSDSAEFTSTLDWVGSPAAFSIKQAEGKIEVEVKDGRYVDFDSGGGRLFGAFNFDSIVRRLELDFSDLYKTGLAFDVIAGGLFLENGVVNTDGGFLIEGPSSRVNVNGEIDFMAETVDVDLLVNIPISQNIAMVAGILGAWPVAVGTYLAGKVFSDQFSGLTAISYHLEGPWSDLNTGFDSAQNISASDLEEVEKNRE